MENDDFTLFNNRLENFLASPSDQMIAYIPSLSYLSRNTSCELSYTLDLSLHDQSIFEILLVKIPSELFVSIQNAAAGAWNGIDSFPHLRPMTITALAFNTGAGREISTALPFIIPEIVDAVYSWSEKGIWIGLAVAGVLVSVFLLCFVLHLRRLEISLQSVTTSHPQNQAAAKQV